MRAQQSMERACEALRTIVGPLGDGNESADGQPSKGFFGKGPAEGYLFRVAMEKKGVYGVADPPPPGASGKESAAVRPKGVPIEYARPQTDTPARVAWNHDWKRS